jgi:hypothetical protein
MLVALVGAGLSGCGTSSSTMMVMVRDAETQAPVVGADVNLRKTQGTSTSRFSRAATLTGADGSVLLTAPVRSALQITVETSDGSYGRFVLDHPALGGGTTWTSPGTIGYEYGVRRFEIAATDWEGGQPEDQLKIKWREPTPRKPVE